MPSPALTGSRVQPPADRVSRVIRLGIATSCIGVALLPLLYDEGWTERVHSVLSILAALGLLATVIAPRRVPTLLFDPAITLAALVLLYTGILVAFDGTEQVVDGAEAWFVGLLAGGVGVVALGMMMQGLDLASRLDRPQAEDVEVIAVLDDDDKDEEGEQ